jgi:hypothetical protein
MESIIQKVKNRLRYSPENQQGLIITEDDLPAIDYVLAVATAQHIPGACAVATPHGQPVRIPEPVWGYLEGSPASMKTELIRLLTDWGNRTFSVDELTENALVSGYEPNRGDGGALASKDGDQECSLAKQIHGKTLLIKDIAPTAAMDPKRLAKVLGQLRSAYDGEYSKGFGTGYKSFPTDFGTLIATTGLIDDLADLNQALGERFIRFSVTRGRPPTMREAAREVLLAYSAAYDKAAWRRECKQLAQGLIEAWLVKIAKDPKFIIPWPTESEISDLSHLSTLLVRVRSSPHEKNVAKPEKPYRVFNATTLVSVTRMLLDGRTKWDHTDRSFGIRILFDTMPRQHNQTLRYLFDQPAEFNISEICICQALGGGTSGAADKTPWLRQWQYSGILEKSAGPRGAYRLSTEAREILGDLKYFDQVDYMPLTA